MIDNFNQIKELLKFENENEFYFIQILQRKKGVADLPLELKGANNSSRLIKAYYIYSLEQFEKQYSEMKTLAKLFNARIGINLNRRNSHQMSLEMLSLLAFNIKCGQYNQLHRIYNTLCGQHHAEKDKIWIVDVDHKNKREINDMLFFIERECEPIGTKFISLIESKSGFHLITTSFNTKKFKDKYLDIDVHKNNPTNLYIP
jgi:ribosomal protein L32